MVLHKIQCKLGNDGRDLVCLDLELKTRRHDRVNYYAGIGASPEFD